MRSNSSLPSVSLSSPEDLVWRFADFVLEKDQELGVKIFTRQGKAEESDLQAWDEKVLNLVQRYPDAHVAYLEHVVLERQSTAEKFHTQLAFLYLDRLQEATKGDGGDLQTRRELAVKFQSLVVASDLVNPSALLSKIDKSEMHHERAILHGKVR